MADVDDGGDQRRLQTRYAPTDAELMFEIHQIKQKSMGGGMTEEEYFYWMKYVRDHAPQNLLIWGLGYDSILIDKLNTGGVTAFLEMNAEWVEKTDNRVLNYRTYKDTEFHTSVSTWRRFLHRPHGTPLTKTFGIECWDTILVDSPQGFEWTSVGRAVPIFTAKQDIEQCIRDGRYADNQTVSVFVHDCYRVAEDKLSLNILGMPIQQIGEKKLRHFVLKSDATSNAVLPPGMSLQLYAMSSTNGGTIETLLTFGLIVLLGYVLVMACRVAIFGMPTSPSSKPVAYSSVPKTDVPATKHGRVEPVEQD